MEITKHKLPKGFTYPLKSSLLQAACEDNGIELPITLRYHPDANLFVADYFFPSTWQDYERISILSGSVISHDSLDAREHMSKSVIPGFIDWVDELINLPENSSKFTGHIFARWTCPKINN